MINFFGREENHAGWLLGLVGIIIGTVVFLWLNTPLGSGISPDSVTYISVSRNLIAGKGLLSISSDGTLIPLSHYPPTYPGLLAVLSLILNQDLLLVTKWLNIVIIVANIILCSVFIYRVTNKSWGYVIVGCLFVMSSIMPVLNIHAFAWTEPLYIMLSLLGFLMLSAFFIKMQYRLLIVSAFTIGIAFMTRYVGVTLIVTGCWCLLLYDKKAIHRRILDIIVFGAVSTLFMMLFLFRNILLHDITTNRSFVFHPIRQEHLTQLTSTSTFRFAFISVLLIGIILLCAMILSRDRQTMWIEMKANILPLPIEFVILAWYLAIYLAFLVFSISFIDARTPLDDRILSPIYIPLVILIAFLFRRILPIVNSIRIVKWIVILSILFVFALQFRNLMSWTNINHQYGVGGYSDVRWVKSPLVEKIVDLPADATIFTNGYDVMYFLTERYSMGLPLKVFITTLEKNPQFSADVEDMVALLENSEGFIIYFDDIGRSHYPTKQELQDTLDLQIIYETDDGVVFQLTAD